MYIKTDEITLQHRSEYHRVGAEAPDGSVTWVGDSGRLPFSTAPFPDCRVPTPESKDLYVKVPSHDESVLQPIRDHIDGVWHPKAMAVRARIASSNQTWSGGENDNL